MKLIKGVIICLFIFVGFLLLLFNLLLFVPAVISYKYGCFPMLIDEGIDSGKIGGVYNFETDDIKIYVEETHPEYEYILKHEKCHRFIHTYTSGGSCLIPPTMIAEEMTCYLSEMF